MGPLKSVLVGIGMLLSAPCVAQQVAVIKYPELEKRLSRTTDTTYVVNFWATWCAPCVKELPAFEQLRTTYATKKVKVLLVSLDYASQLDKKVKPFVKQHSLQSEVVILNETDPNTWLDKVDPKWSGALPFTLIINNKIKKRVTFEKELSAVKLKAAIQSFF